MRPPRFSARTCLGCGKAKPGSIWAFVLDGAPGYWHLHCFRAAQKKRQLADKQKKDKPDAR